MDGELACGGPGNHEKFCEVGLGVATRTLDDIRWYGRCGSAKL